MNYPSVYAVGFHHTFSFYHKYIRKFRSAAIFLVHIGVMLSLVASNFIGFVMAASAAPSERAITPLESVLKQKSIENSKRSFRFQHAIELSPSEKAAAVLVDETIFAYGPYSLAVTRPAGLLHGEAYKQVVKPAQELVGVAYTVASGTSKWGLSDCGGGLCPGPKAWLWTSEGTTNAGEFYCADWNPYAYACDSVYGAGN